MKRISGSLALTALLAAAIFAGSAGETKAAITYSFSGVTNNSATNTAIGVTQLSVTVADAGAGQVSFTFSNAGPAASTISEIYFDDGTLLGIASISGSAGVAFSPGASPGDLPGGNTIDFNTTKDFLASANNPAPSNGVNPGDTVTITFSLISGQTFADTINAINLALATPNVDVTGGLRIGIHVINFANGGSESFVNGPPSTNPVPEPSTVVLALTGLSTLGLTALRRRRLV